MGSVHHAFLLSVFGVIAGQLACGPNVDVALREQAAQDLRCPVANIEIPRQPAGVVSATTVRFNYEIFGCGKTVTYQCSAPLRQIGPFEYVGRLTCTRKKGPL